MGQEDPMKSRGQQELRQSWQLLKGQTDKRVTEDLMKSRFLTSIAESYWASEDPGSFSELHLNDPQVAYIDLARHLHQSFFLFSENLKRSFSFFSSVFQHPLNAAPVLLRLVDLLIVTFSISFILISVFYLWGWAHPISKDWPRLFPSPTIFRLILLVALVVAGFFGEWILLSLLSSGLILQYSRTSKASLSIALLSVLFWSFQILRPGLEKSIDAATALEALHRGRTKIEYSSAAVDQLNPFESAIWSDMNGDRGASRYWIEKSPDGYEKDLFLAVLTARDGGAQRGVAEFEKLDEKYGPQARTLFNLAKVYTATQNLLAADRVKEKMNAQEIDQLTAEAAARNSDFVIQVRDRSFQTFWEVWKTELQSQRIALISFLSAPLLFLLFSFYRRSKSSGLCDFTGEATPQVEAVESQLYQSTRSKMAKNNQLQRQSVEMLIRSHQRIQQKRSQHWSWLIPSFRSLVFHQNWGRSFIICFFFSLILVFSLPTDFFPNTWTQFRPLSFFMPGVGVFGLLFIAHIFDSYRKVSR